MASLTSSPAERSSGRYYAVHRWAKASAACHLAPFPSHGCGAIVFGANCVRRANEIPSPSTGADKGRYRFLPPWWGQVRMGGKCRDLTPALPHRGGGERLAAFPGDIPTPVSPTRGERHTLRAPVARRTVLGEDSGGGEVAVPALHTL